MSNGKELDTFLLAVLDAIEKKEARLLVWGVVDGRLAQEELSDLIDPLLDQALVNGLTGLLDTNDVIAALRHRALLFETDDAPYPGFRSRMAETVRLLFRLRQMFPKHTGPDGWQHAATLVSDFRFLWRRRRYPQRTRTLPTILDELRNTVQNHITREAFGALLNGRGGDFKLAAFQVRAATRISKCLEGRRSSGTLVSAGTGSGKTLAFYLPALARIASHLSHADTPWVKVLAIYPRTELLRDQFAEIYREARRLDPLLKKLGVRKIRIGSIFGGTPASAAAMDKKLPTGWKSTTGGIVCSYMPCPKEGCDGELVWLNDDRRANRESLVCRTCETKVGSDEVALTRQEMRQTPPDILFSTTEMLNQRMADSDFRHLFGLPPQATRPVEMVLLDEVHTYAGLHGAQVAFLLRRWQHLVRAPISFVGLSATLRDGVNFFAQLTGLNAFQVEDVAARHDEMCEESAEYLLALRGDPVSRTSLLSTTIQTAMLISRALDHETKAKSQGLYGYRTFVFTDDLDVTNRLYFSLLDAEGRGSNGNLDMRRHPNGPLAVLRRSMFSRSRDRYGQNWTMPEEVGHNLIDRKQIGRTSSQDPGVTTNADVIVATASLEVGFNDPSVGAVIQHKAPRETSQFLQRKGRAGRSHRMRPWTIVVLSDYGRDRLAYQGYDRLFDPELPTPSLPLFSQYIRRIQAVYALIDYLGLDGRDGQSRGNVWKDLLSPGNPDDPYWNKTQRRQTFLVNRLASVLKSDVETEALAKHISQALRLSTEEVMPLLWEYPRPLLTTVIPTALRRLSTNWRCGNQPMADYQMLNTPLPEFVPGQLFGDLNLPEVSVVVPGSDPNPMPVAQAMSAFVPGRVSRRFGRHWVGPTQVPVAGWHAIDIGTFYHALSLGHWLVRRDEGVVALPVFRPFEIRPVQPPRQVQDTSNARLVWHTQIVAERSGLLQSLPKGTPWGKLVSGIEAFLHSEQRPIEVRRFAVESEADIQVERQGSVRVKFGYQYDGIEAAIGFAVSVDALCLRLTLPRDLWRHDTPASASMWRALRTARFFDLAWSGERLAMVDNPFARKWLAEIYFSALTFDALIREVLLPEADSALVSGTATLALSDVLSTIFQSPQSLQCDSNETGLGETDRLRQELEAFLHNSDVLKELHNLGRILWESLDNQWEAWLRQRFKSTIAAAALEAIRDLCPDIGESGLVVDCDPGARTPATPLANGDGDEEVWISETTPGGTGHIEAFLRHYAEDPRRFHLLMAFCLQSTDHELVDYQLTRFLDMVAGGTTSPELASAVRACRITRSHSDSVVAMTSLRKKMRQNGFVLFHSFLSALANRVLRPGSSEESDIFLRKAISHWDVEEQRLGIELQASVIAYALSQDDAIDQVLAAVGLVPPSDNVNTWRYNAIYGLLWPRGGLVRRAGLGLYNPFATLPDPERLLVAEFLANSSARINLEEEGWYAAILTQLRTVGVATLVCPAAQADQLSEALNFLATNPVESEYLSVFARINALRRVGEIYEAELEIMEFAQ